VYGEPRDARADANTSPTLPPCPVGSWRTTAVKASATATGLRLSFDGGFAVNVTIGKDGKVMADFSGMQPVVFSTQVGTAQVRGEVTDQGSEDGTVAHGHPPSGLTAGKAVDGRCGRRRTRRNA
jgi:hypothetical protein